MKAYAVTWREMPETPVIIAATKAGRARYTAYLMLMDVRRGTTFAELRAVRAPEWDFLAAEQTIDGRRVFEVDAAAFAAPSSLEPR